MQGSINKYVLYTITIVLKNSNSVTQKKHFEFVSRNELITRIKFSIKIIRLIFLFIANLNKLNYKIRIIALSYENAQHTER